MNALVIFSLLAVLMLTGMPISISLGLTVLTFLFTMTQVPLESVALKLFTGIEKFEIMAIPFFILAGNFLTHGGVAKRMINFATSMVGHWYGGLGLAGVVACALFAAVSGSSPATVVAIGSILLPAMVKAGFPSRFGAGVISTSGAGTVPGHATQHASQGQTRDDAGHEQGADRGIGRHRVHHHDDGRRDQDAERTGGRDDAGPEAVREACLDHRRQQDGADGHHRRRAGTGYRREQGAGQHAGQAETTMPVTDHRGREVDHPFRHPAVGQEVTGQDEERNGHDLELLDAREQLECHGLQRHLRHGEQEGQNG
jgi:hypothetical protein